MDVRTHYPYSLLRHGLIYSYPALTASVNTEVIIIGAGITGALCAWHLQEAGFDCIVVDKGHVAMGSTAASTSLIQYEIDQPLLRLAEQLGLDRAFRAYQRSRLAVHELSALCRQLHSADLFQDRCSLQFASSQKDAKRLRQEFELREALGFALEWREQREIESDFGFSAPAALWTAEAGQLDVYRFTHVLLADAVRKGAQVYDHTGVREVRYHRKGAHVHTTEGHTISARQVIFACGYESSEYFPGIREDLRCTFAFVSEPMKEKELWKDNCLIWETADPYLYLRMTDDHRVLVGGADTRYLPLKEQLRRLPQKTENLLARFQKLFPHIDLHIDFTWAGTFATTPDGLPYIGRLNGQKNAYIALGYGGNGITFSLIAAQQITALISGKTDPDADIFSSAGR